MTIRAIVCFKAMLHGTFRNAGTMLQAFKTMSPQCCNPACAKNRRCESSRVTSPFISLSLEAKFEF